jgi:hypothetical protein
VVKRLLILMSFAILLLVGVDLHAAELYDIMGRHVLTIENDVVVNDAGPVIFFGGEYNSLYDNTTILPVGIYFIKTDKEKYRVFDSVLDDFSFNDVTVQFLPQYALDASGVQIGDINNDGLEDIVFSRYPMGIDTSEDYRLRVLIQNADNTFTDESLLRIPPVSTPCLEFRIIDAENDGDIDIFTPGINAVTYRIPAALFINDGTGHFADESSTRLPAITSPATVYLSDVGDANGDGFADLIVNIMDYSQPPTSGVFTLRLWLNDTQGNFYSDSLGRLPPNNGYSFFMPFFNDIDNDSNQDLLSANLELIVTNPSGDTIMVLSGQNTCYRNTGNGFYVDETEARIPGYDNQNTRDMAFSDIDNDGDMDIAEIGFYFGQYNEQNRILLNGGTGYYSVSQNAFPAGAVGWFNDTKFGILNDDFSPDIFMIRVLPGTPDYDVLLLNNGNGIFTDSSSVLPEICDFSTSAELFDHQNDNDNDIFIVNSGSGPMDTVGQNRLYHNMLYVPTGINHDPGYPSSSLGLFRLNPNPFNSSTKISFSLSEPGAVALSIYNIQGQRVVELVRGNREAGEHSITWDASEYPSGIYFSRLEAGGLSKTTKMILLK